MLHMRRRQGPQGKVVVCQLLVIAVPTITGLSMLPSRHRQGVFASANITQCCPTHLYSLCTAEPCSALAIFCHMSVASPCTLLTCRHNNAHTASISTLTFPLRLACFTDGCISCVYTHTRNVSTRHANRLHVTCFSLLSLQSHA